MSEGHPSYGDPTFSLFFRMVFIHWGSYDQMRKYNTEYLLVHKICWDITTVRVIAPNCTIQGAKHLIQLCSLWQLWDSAARDTHATWFSRMEVSLTMRSLAASGTSSPMACRYLASWISSMICESQFTNSSPVSGWLTSSEAFRPLLAASTARHQPRWYSIWEQECVSEKKARERVLCSNQRAVSLCSAGSCRWFLVGRSEKWGWHEQRIVNKVCWTMYFKVCCTVYVLWTRTA